MGGTLTNASTKTYTYGNSNWGDLLTGYNGYSITYDASGNPLSYLGATLTWREGRRLATYSKGGKTASYIYNSNGIRTSKTVGGVGHTYILNGSQILCEKWGSSYIEFFYDESGRPHSANYYNGSSATKYYYVLNGQGDVVQIRSQSQSVIANYSYDAWGKVLSVTNASGATITSATHFANLNPLRYRGYYYDTESSLYYLQSRYYDPEVGRFLNADAFVSTGQGILSYNMFAYCGNNPVRRIDAMGSAWKDIVNGAKEMWNEVTGYAQSAINYVTNDDESVVQENLQRDGFSFYKGVPVFAADWLGYGGFSYGIIGIGSKNLGRYDFDETLNHEYGHIRHFTRVGPVDYFVNTAVPSLTFAGLTNADVFPQKYYFDLPWERTADHLGGVERGYLPATNTLASIYWLSTLLSSNQTLY